MVSRILSVSICFFSIPPPWVVFLVFWGQRLWKRHLPPHHSLFRAGLGCWYITVPVAGSNNILLWSHNQSRDHSRQRSGRNELELCCFKPWTRRNNGSFIFEAFVILHKFWEDYVGPPRSVKHPFVLRNSTVTFYYIFSLSNLSVGNFHPKSGQKNWNYKSLVMGNLMPEKNIFSK